LSEQIAKAHAMHEPAHQRQPVIGGYPPDRVSQAVKIIPVSPRSSHNRRRSCSFARIHIVQQPFQKTQMLANRPAAIYRSRWAAPHDSGQRFAVGLHNLQRKQPAHEGLGVGSEDFMNPTSSVVRQKHTASIGPMI
jgi:hypothetical protein